MADLSIEGADALLGLSRRLRQAGQTELKREMSKALRDAGKPLIAKTREAARQELPQRGGLARHYARVPQRVQVRTGAQTAGVRIVIPRGQRRGITDGRLRHPVFGHQDRQVVQQVSGTWWDETLEREAPGVVEREMVPALSRIAEQITEG